MAPDLQQQATQPNAYTQSAGLMGQATDVYKQLAQGGGLQNVNAYLNSYYEQVVQSTLQRMGIDRDQSMGQLGDAAASSGAFGGSRHGLAEGELLAGYNRNAGDITANLMGQGFNQAANMSRADMLTGAQGMGNMAGAYYNIGNNIADRQLAAGNQQQQLLQTILSGGAQQYNQLVNSPNQMLNILTALAQGDPRNQSGSVQQSSTPGLYDYLALGANMGAAAMMGGA